jgi:hypothetical protein
VTTLTGAIYALLPLINDVVHAHSTSDGSQLCRHCRIPAPCEHLGTAITALDLVLQVHLRAQAVAPLRHPAQPEPATEDHNAASYLRGLERARAELIDGRVSPDACFAIMVIIGAIDIGRRILVADAETSETFNHGVLLGVLDRAVTELTGLDPHLP